MPQGVSIRAYARHRKCWPRAVQKAMAARIKAAVFEDGSIDVELADRLWDGNTDLSKPSNTVTGDPHHRREPGGPSLPVGGRKKDRAAPVDQAQFMKAQTAKAVYAAGLMRRRLLEEDKRLVPAADVERVFASACRIVIDRIEGMRHSLDPLLAAEVNAEARQLLWKEELGKIRAELTRAARMNRQAAEAGTGAGAAGEEPTEKHA